MDRACLSRWIINRKHLFPAETAADGVSAAQRHHLECYFQRGVETVTGRVEVSGTLSAESPRGGASCRHHGGSACLFRLLQSD